MDERWYTMDRPKSKYPKMSMSDRAAHGVYGERRHLPAVCREAQHNQAVREQDVEPRREGESDTRDNQVEEGQEVLVSS